MGESDGGRRGGGGRDVWRYQLFVGSATQVFSGWEVHPRCALIAADGESDAGEDRFGIVVVGEVGRPRQGAVHLGGLLPRLHIRTDGAVSEGRGQQLRIAWLWEDVPPGGGDEGKDGADVGDSEADRS